MEWRNDPVYQTLEAIASNAGIRIVYQCVPDDAIDGAIWARSDGYGSVMMPDNDDAFDDAETACLVLGHEIGHILAGVDSPDQPAERRKNEAICDLIGYYLFQLAVHTYEKQEYDAWNQISANQDNN